jgi:hypothetical protein
VVVKIDNRLRKYKIESMNVFAKQIVSGDKRPMSRCVLISHPTGRVGSLELPLSRFRAFQTLWKVVALSAQDQLIQGERCRVQQAQEVTLLDA